jgi:hypothetical protein
MRPINRSEILYRSRKYIRLGENRPSELKNGIRVSKSVWTCDSSSGNFKWSYKKYTFGGQMAKIGLQSWLLGLSSVFGIWKLIFAFLTPKSIHYVTPCNIPDQWISRPYRPFLSSGGLFSPFLTPKRVYFLDLYKISDRLMGRMTYFIFVNFNMKKNVFVAILDSAAF